MRDTLGLDPDIVDENRIPTEAPYGGTFFSYGEDRIGYQTADGDVTIVTDIGGFGTALADQVSGSLHGDDLDHVAVPFSHPTESEGAYDFPTATAVTRYTIADQLIANTQFTIRGAPGQNPADYLNVLLEEENPLLNRVEEELYGLPEQVGETVAALGGASSPWGGVVYQKEPLENILHDEVRHTVAYETGDEQIGLEVPEAALGASDLPAEAVPASIGGEPVEIEDVDEEDTEARPAESLGDGPWDDQIDTWTEE